MGRDFSTLPESVRLEDTVAEHDAVTLGDPDAVRNLEQHEALRDD